jgi:hypothetical protein
MKSKTKSVDEVKATRLITAIKTPYLPDGKVDLAMYDALVEKQIAAGIGGLIVGGTTGEGQLMSWDEHIMLIAHTAKLYGDNLCIVGNTGSNSTREAVHATSQGFAVGAASLPLNRPRFFSCLTPLAKSTPRKNIFPPRLLLAHSLQSALYSFVLFVRRDGCRASDQSVLRENEPRRPPLALQRGASLWAYDCVQCPRAHVAGHHP